MECRRRAGWREGRRVGVGFGGGHGARDLDQRTTAVSVSVTGSLLLVRSRASVFVASADYLEGDGS